MRDENGEPTERKDRNESQMKGKMKVGIPFQRRMEAETKIKEGWKWGAKIKEGWQWGSQSNQEWALGA
jgi:hypothetical protein